VELENKLLQIELERVTEFCRLVIAAILLCGYEDCAISKAGRHI
jgi:hypothetical protein